MDPSISNIFGGLAVIVGHVESGDDIVTSSLQRLSYDALEDTTFIYTQNKMYTTEGNIIKDQLGTYLHSIRGADLITQALSNHLSYIKEH